MNPLCSICGKTKEEHHEFREVKRPEGCVCDTETWADDISPICDKYEGNGKTYCETCEHDKECHKN